MKIVNIYNYLDLRLLWGVWEVAVLVVHNRTESPAAKESQVQ